MTYPLDKLCVQVFKLDRRVRYAGVLDATGRLIAGGMRKGITSLEPARENLRLMANLTMQIATDKTWDRYFGGMWYTFVKREKVNVLTFYLGGKNVMMISTESVFDLDDVDLLRDTVMTMYSDGIVPVKAKR
jgi:hypothetical protein